VAELGYVPNRAARALASSQSKVIAVLVPSLSNACSPKCWPASRMRSTPTTTRS
jgi:DNA-binding LacI/PurR family transcriptional regulator